MPLYQINNAIRRRRKRKAIIGAEQLIVAAAALVLLILAAPPKTFFTGVWITVGIVLAGALTIAALSYVLRKPKPSTGSSKIEPGSADTTAREPAREPAGKPERDLYPMWKASTALPARPSAVDTSKWSLDLLGALEWKRFEELTAAFFQCVGFKAKTTRCGADGGIDIHLFVDGSETPSAIVQCKAWKTYKVGVKPIRELLGVMTQQGVKEGAFITTGTFTKEAREFVAPAGTEIDLIDGPGFLAKIASLSPQQQSWLLDLATAGDFTTPTCASCGVKMTLRENKKKGDTFWGCVNYPRCRMTFPMVRTTT